MSVGFATCSILCLFELACSRAQQPFRSREGTRSKQHKKRDLARQKTEDTSPYVNGVLFGFDPNIPLEDQVEGWRMATEPDPEQLAELGLAGKAWLKKEQRHMGDEK